EAPLCAGVTGIPVPPSPQAAVLLLPEVFTGESGPPHRIFQFRAQGGAGLRQLRSLHIGLRECLLGAAGLRPVLLGSGHSRSLSALCRPVPPPATPGMPEHTWQTALPAHVVGEGSAALRHPPVEHLFLG